MKNLRQLLRSGWFGSKPRQARPNAKTQKRRLSTEALERRELLAGDVFLASNPLHNGWRPFDVNDDGRTSAADANAAISRISRAAEGELGSDGFFPDTNNDGRVTALDALGVINNMNAEGEPDSDDLVSLFLTARGLDDQPLDVVNGAVNVNVGDDFFLEVSYSDLRNFGADIGAFQLVTDLGISDTGFLQPVVAEHQTFTFDANLFNATSGDYVFTRNGQSETVPFGTFASGPAAAVNDALIALGLTADQFSLDFQAGDPNTNTPIIIDIQYIDYDTFGNVDAPNITIADNLDVAAPVTVREIPALANGLPNPAAIPFNLDLRSRTFNVVDDPFGSVFFALNPIGQFQEGDSLRSDGFTNVGGIGPVPTNGGGVPELDTSGEIVEPFDAFSVRVEFIQATTGFTVNASPGTRLNDNGTAQEPEPEAVLLFGRDDAVPPSMVDFEDAIVTFNAIDDGGPGNQPPVLATTPLTTSANEGDAGTTTFSLLTGASDPDNDVLSIVGFTPVAGITQSGTDIIIDPNDAAFDALNTGESQSLDFNYTISDGNGGTVGQTVTVTINGLTDPPTNTAPTSTPVSQTFNESDQPGDVNLLQNANDADGDNLTVSNVQLSNTGNNGGITIDEANARLTVTPQFYGDLLDSTQTEVVEFTYTISDGTDSITETATITIVGADAPNIAPVAGDLSRTFSQNDGIGTIDLISTSTDVDGDTLTATVGTATGDDSGISVNGNTMTVDPSAYARLGVNQTEVVTFPLTVSDGSAQDTAVVTVTINGENDNPVVSGQIVRQFNINQADQNPVFSLLSNASDPDTGDVLTVSGQVVSGNAAGITTPANRVEVDLSAYSSLASGSSEVILVNYSVDDNNGGSVNHSARITIVNDANVNTPPTVGDPVTASFNEDDATGSVELLTGASDADGDTLNVTGLTLTSGDDSGVTINGNTLSINPAAYASLNTGQTAVIEYGYSITDGTDSVSQTATITIVGEDEPVNNSNPVVSAAVTGEFSEDDNSGVVSLLTGASDPDGDTLNVGTINLRSGNDGGISIDGNSLTVNPAFYGNLLVAGQSETIIYDYTIIDGNGGTVDQTATITITGADDGPTPSSVISGTLFIDHIDNFPEVAQGADPVRNGERDVDRPDRADEPALASVRVSLTSPASENSTGAIVERSTLTNIEGVYTFANVAPGTYTLSYELPNGIVFLGAATEEVVIAAAGGQTAAGPALGAISLGSAISNLDILASSYLAANQEMSLVSDGGSQGGSVALDALGNQQLFVAGLGLDGVDFAELALNDARDAALLTIVESNTGAIRTARLNSEQFVVSQDGSAVQFFGGMEDFDFVSDPNSLITQEFSTFGNAIDAAMRDGII